MSELRLADVRITQERGIHDSAQNKATTMTLNMSWRGASASPLVPSSTARSYAVVNTAGSSSSNRALDALNRWIMVHARVWPEDRDAFLFPHMERNGLGHVNEPFDLHSYHEMLKELTDSVQLTSSEHTFSSDAIRNGAMIDTLLNCGRRGSDDLRRWISWAGCALGEVPGSFAGRIQDEFVRVRSPAQTFGSEIPSARLLHQSPQTPSGLAQMSGDTDSRGRLSYALDRLAKGNTSGSWFDLAQACSEMGSQVGSGSSHTAPSSLRNSPVRPGLASAFSSPHLPSMSGSSSTLGHERQFSEGAIPPRRNALSLLGSSNSTSAVHTYDVHEHGMHIH